MCIYIYIYVCVCVCVCVYKNSVRTAKKAQHFTIRKFSLLNTKEITARLYGSDQFINAVYRNKHCLLWKNVLNQ
jgi:hypothetical protein